MKNVAARNRRVPELMGVREVAEALGVSDKNLGKVARLPEPALVLKAGRFWRADVIREFAAERKEQRDG
jgi:hypothetical protein